MAPQRRVCGGEAHRGDDVLTDGAVPNDSMLDLPESATIISSHHFLVGCELQASATGVGQWNSSKNTECKYQCSLYYSVTYLLHRNALQKCM